MNDDNRDREKWRRSKEKQRECSERQRRERANDDVGYKHLRSGDDRHRLAPGGHVVDAEIRKIAKVDEASALAAGQFDKQVWQQQVLETVQEAQQSLWAMILRLSSCHDSAGDQRVLSSLFAVAKISADDENTLRAIDAHIRSSEINERFPDLIKELKVLRSKVENYRLVREIVEKTDA